MKAIVKNKDQVELVTREIPKIISDDDILIKVEIAGLCRTDLYTAQGLIEVKDSVILGHELSGIVANQGKNVKSIKIGNKVSVMPILINNFQEKMLGIDLDGAFAEYLLIPANCCYPIPEYLSFQEGAFLEPITACLAVTKAPINPKQKGLIYGHNRIATLIQRILNIKGFKNIEIYDCQNQNDLLENSYDFIIETVASNQAFQEIIKAIKHQGLILLKSRTFSDVSLPIKTIVQKEIKLCGVYYGDFQEAINLLVNQELNVKDLFGKTINFQEAIEILSGEKYYDESQKIFLKP